MKIIEQTTKQHANRKSGYTSYVYLGEKPNALDSFVGGEEKRQVRVRMTYRHGDTDLRRATKELIQRKNEWRSIGKRGQYTIYLDQLVLGVQCHIKLLDPDLIEKMEKVATIEPEPPAPPKQEPAPEPEPEPPQPPPADEQDDEDEPERHTPPKEDGLTSLFFD